jgi:tetratricopeptide (TPR) repeat protein
MGDTQQKKQIKQTVRVPFQRGLLALLVTCAFSVEIFAQSAAPIPQGTEPLVQAQAFFARLDFQNTYKYALEALRKDGQNIEARRLAAKAAKELEKYPDCIRLVAGIPQGQIRSEDVGLLGDCSADAPASPSLLNFFQQNLQVPDNRDMASYWLGRNLYRKGDYTKAESYLKRSVALPERLEKERTFMLDRIRDVKGASKPPMPVQTPNKPPLKNPNSNAQSGTTKGDEPAGFFFRPSATGSLISGSTQNRRVPLEPGTQDAYELNSEAELIKNSSTNKADVGASLRAEADLGFRSAKTAKGAMTRIGIEVGADAAAGATEQRFYLSQDQGVRPVDFIPLTRKGWSVGVRPFLLYDVNSNFSLEGGAGFNLMSTNFKRNYSNVLGEVLLKIGFDNIVISGGYMYEAIAAKDGRRGSVGFQWKSDFRIGQTGFLSLESPQGYELLKFSRYGTQDSEDVVFLTQAEGSFWEINLAPRVHFSDSLSFLTWIRYVYATSRSFVSGVTARIVEDQKKLLFRPNAEFSSSSTETTLALEWDPMEALTLSAGSYIRRFSTTYTEDEITDVKFKPLLDSATDNATSFFGSVHFRF